MSNHYTEVEIAKELLKNSYNISIKRSIENYILNFEELEQREFENKNYGQIRLHNCISYIKEANFDITGWMLFEIPTFYSHVFMNKNTNQFFDLAVWDIGKVIPRYIDEDTCEQDAKSIEEAIKNYSEIYKIN